MIGLIRRLPVLSTVLVLIAVGVMIRLGFWQLDRRAEKEEMLARYEAAQSDLSPLRWPSDQDRAEQLLYRRAWFDCDTVGEKSAIAGRNAAGVAGVAITAQCTNRASEKAWVIMGWSEQPLAPDWPGGEVSGMIAPGPRLVADPPLAGLAANALPDPSSIPNNHLSYAVQWFLFAATALVIYALAVRKRLAAGR